MARLLVVMDEKGIRAEVEEKPHEVMVMAERALTASIQGLESVPDISHEDALSLMDAPIKTYKDKAMYGEKVAEAMMFVEFLKHC